MMLEEKACAPAGAQRRTCSSRLASPTFCPAFSTLDASSASLSSLRFRGVAAAVPSAATDPVYCGARGPEGIVCSGAGAWGLWREDPGPKGVRLSGYHQARGDGRQGTCRLAV